MDKTSRGVEVRVTAVGYAMELVKVKHIALLNTETLLEDAEKIEKYILGYEAKPEGE